MAPYTYGWASVWIFYYYINIIESGIFIFHGWDYNICALCRLPRVCIVNVCQSSHNIEVSALCSTVSKHTPLEVWSMLDTY